MYKLQKIILIHRAKLAWEKSHEILSDVVGMIALKDNTSLQPLLDHYSVNFETFTPLDS